MISALSKLTDADKADHCVSFALAFRSAWSLNNYHRMFRLYLRAPKMSAYVIDMFCQRERLTAIKTMVKAYVLPFSHLLIAMPCVYLYVTLFQAIIVFILCYYRQYHCTESVSYLPLFCTCSLIICVVQIPACPWC